MGLPGPGVALMWLGVEGLALVRPVGAFLCDRRGPTAPHAESCGFIFVIYNAIL